MEIRRRPPSPPVNVDTLEFKVQVADADPRNILEKIVWYKEGEVERRREKLPLQQLKSQVQTAPPVRDFWDALAHGKTQPALIAEVKKASPSKGVIREDFDPVAIATTYAAAGASCISVLTDSEFFQGSFDYLQQIRQVVDVPLLCKEFVIYPYQIFLARTCGADAVLLIAAILSDQDLQYFVKIIKSLGMTALVEVHTEAELQRVLAVDGVTLIGINNRNLEDFTVDLATTQSLLATYGHTCQDRNILVVSESGIHTPADVQTVATAGAKAILVGESLVKQPDPGEAIAQLFP
ncbi:MAG: indole-3-glycerol phosphate synthase TrpC [Leptolyngbyaceae bacterium]|nr:indole-3-glycerol phosphate synthase TrpC [Leptolyngbyaceae bacterium]